MKTTLTLSVLAFTACATVASAADLGGPRGPAVVVAPGPAEDRLPPVIVQLGPTTPYSTIDCAAFTKLPDGSWKAIAPQPFGLGFVQGIVPPARAIKVGSYIYNNIDLYSQLELQCAAGAGVVQARY